jgi:hypothetical protein
MSLSARWLVPRALSKVFDSRSMEIMLSKVVPSLARRRDPRID